MQTSSCNGGQLTAGSVRGGLSGAREDQRGKTPHDDFARERRWRGFSRREVVTLILQCMSELGYHNAVKTLEEESGFFLEDPSITVLHEAVLQGKWVDVQTHLNALPLRPQIRKACWFLAVEQKYFEALVRGDEGEAIRCLREELQPAVFDSSTSRRLQACSALLMQSEPGALLENLSVLSDTLRSNLWLRMKHLLPPTLSLPNSRLAVLLAYALQHQTLMCLFHNTNTSLESYSLLHDHHCHHYDPCSLSLPLGALHGPLPGAGDVGQWGGGQLRGEATALKHAHIHHAPAAHAEEAYRRSRRGAAASGEAATAALLGTDVKPSAASPSALAGGSPRTAAARESFALASPSLSQGYAATAPVPALSGYNPRRVSANGSVSGTVGSTERDFVSGPVCGRSSLPVYLDRSLEAHTDEVWVVAASPVTGCFFASGSKDRSIAVWRVQPKARLPFSSRSLSGAAISDAAPGHPTGCCVTADKESGLAAADDPGGDLGTSSSFLRHRSDSAAPRGSSSSGTQDRTPRQRNGERRNGMRLGDDQQEGCPRASELAVCAFDEEDAEVEEVCELLWQSVGHDDAVAYIAWSRDERMLASGGQDGYVCVWDRENGRAPLARINAHSQAVTAVGWLKGSNALVSGGSDKKVALCSLAYGDGSSGTRGWHITCDFTWALGCRVQDLAVLRDGLRIICVTQDKQLRILDTKHRVEMISIPFTEVIYSVCASALSNQFLIHFADARPVVRLWDVDERRSVQRYRGHKQGCYVIRSTFGGVNEAFVVSGSEDSQVYIWHRFYGSLLFVLSGHASTVNAVAWPHHNGGLWMVSASDDHVILFWQGRRRKTFHFFLSASEDETDENVQHPGTALQDQEKTRVDGAHSDR
ncbi:WD domain, G-beta repeat-containing protein [Besnoitia besnoiti]|uniref:WD domain, G-beta repeat-containing protein n=1 Tax=Besnoitia besnoiti TaxID=94643 RepID=A0A2A9MJQ2_BESBE|nr:WD domain, G-beta repeat-containing protein [Besnoitia besnoiti]PFH35630.1 WD domain, G-beta repeat-containing protein [Besnoitia besnoiti]